MKRPTLALALCLTLLTAACVNSAEPGELGFVTPDEAGNEVVDLTLWVWEGTIDEARIEEFQLQYPGVDIDIRYSSFDQHHTGLRSAIESGGDVPDVAAIEIAYLPVFFAHPEDFTDLQTFGADNIADDYLEWRWAQGVGPEGEILGLPTDVGGLAFAYRRDLFTEAGLPSDPVVVGERFATWEGFIETGKEFAAAGTGVSFIDSVESVYHARFAQGPIGYVDADGAYAFDTSETFTEAWDLATESIEHDLNAPLAQFGPEWNDAMANDGFAVVASPSWMRNYLEATAPASSGKWGLVAVPGTAGNWGGSHLAIPAGAEHPDEAWELIHFLAGVEGQKSLFERAGNLPSTPGLYEEIGFGDLSDSFFRDQVVGQIYVESLLTLEPRRYADDERQVDRAFITALQDYDAGELKTASQAKLRALTLIDTFDNN